MKVCQICGDAGYSDLLIHCKQCQITTVHRYCVDNPSACQDENPKWLCEDCAPKIIVIGLPCRNSEDIISKRKQVAVQKTAKKKGNNKKSFSVAGKDIGTSQGAQKVGSRKSKKGLKIKGGTTKLKLVEQIGNEILLLPNDSDGTKISPSATVKGTNERLDQSTDVQKDGSAVKCTGKKSKDLNKDKDVKQGSSEAVHVNAQKKEINSCGAIIDQCLKLGKELESPLQKERDRVNVSVSNSGENVHGESELGPLLPRDDHIGESTRKAEGTIEFPVSDLLHKHEQFSHEIHSGHEEPPNSFKNPAQASKQVECVDNRMSEVIEETVADIVLDQHNDVQSYCNSFEGQPPRKRRRFIIEMDYSDEEPVVFVANHPARVLDGREDPLLTLKVDGHGLSQGSCKEFDGPQPPPMEIDRLVRSQESPSAVISRALAPSPEKLNNYFPAEPLNDSSWRGSCIINATECPMSLALEAHLSNKAHAKVQGAASALPQCLDFEFVLKQDAWPKRFQESPPTGDAIGLYFFPVDERDEKTYWYLMDKMIEHGLILRSHINNLELLIFSSRELPQQERCFRRRYYLWGVFKPRKDVITPNKSSVTRASNVYINLPTGCSTDTVSQNKSLGTIRGMRYSKSMPRVDKQAACFEKSNSRVHGEAVDHFVELNEASALKPRDQAYDRQLHSDHREHNRISDASNGKFHKGSPQKPWRYRDRRHSRRDFESRSRAERRYDNDNDHSRRHEHSRRWKDKDLRDPVHSRKRRYPTKY